uniref:mannose-6-phosphate isomerase n=1 Tax=Meloidogyne hapla TaxID=6305 RepID=A0A1I8BYU0_MELHA
MKRLECKALHYQWGRKGAESTVAQLRKDTIEEDEYYAELWMGTHARGPSQVKEGEARIPLADYFKDHPDVLGQHEKDGTGLQFLLKVLSVGKCLSLQLHPTKEQARELHAADQANYPDDNHKPELTIALTDFEILCGFQKPDAILQNLRSHEALVELIGEKGLLSFDATQGEEEKKAALKNIFTQIWTIPPEEIGTLLTKLLADIFLSNSKIFLLITYKICSFSEEQRSQTDDLIMGLSEHFPEDIGILAPLFLNYVKLKPGEATFLGPNEPHSYLSGGD